MIIIHLHFKLHSKIHKAVKSSHKDSHGKTIRKLDSALVALKTGLHFLVEALVKSLDKGQTSKQN